ncbi:MAG: thioredoxin-dependent thiol peroxidase [Gammaproteobacteria bacterium]|nr:thioredoxin-dependent thiol peroxidase [Gammaproteobacteria bacterium]
MTLNVGDKAPEFSLLSDKNEKITLSELRGKKVVLYFYPKDNTPGCTKEACDFRDALPQFTESNTLIFGISKDNPKKHTQFKEKYNLPFTLLADENADVCAAYGVIDKKSLFGKTFLGIQRSTFLIDENGMIKAIWRKVKVPTHIQAVLQESTQR